MDKTSLLRLGEDLRRQTTNPRLLSYLDGTLPLLREEVSPKPGRPLLEKAHLSLERTRPWEALGMSRTTWFRRRKAKS
jgi:hypothetical protein